MSFLDDIEPVPTRDVVWDHADWCEGWTLFVWGRACACKGEERDAEEAH